MPLRLRRSSRKKNGPRSRTPVSAVKDAVKDKEEATLTVAGLDSQFNRDPWTAGLHGIQHWSELADDVKRRLAVLFYQQMIHLWSEWDREQARNKQQGDEPHVKGHLLYDEYMRQRVRARQAEARLKEVKRDDARAVLQAHLQSLGLEARVGLAVSEATDAMKEQGEGINKTLQELHWINLGASCIQM